MPQEEELADAKKPDIRIHGVGFDGPVPIELKIMDNKWSGANLVERLNNQLCGQYLRDIRSNCGIFLLIYLGKKMSWKHPKTDKKLDFYKLVSFLEKEVKKITVRNNKVESIEIIGIDLKKRLFPDRKKKENKEKRESLLNLEDIAVETGISDLAEHHDHYLYGVPKKDE